MNIKYFTYPTFSQDYSSSPKEWTVIALINGNTKSSSKTASAILRELEKVGTSKNLNIVAQISKRKLFTDKISKDWNGTRRYKVIQNQKPVNFFYDIIHQFIPPFTKNIASILEEELDDNSKNSASFVDYAINNYPAKHYMLIFCGDENKELKEIVSQGKESADKKIDLVVFNQNEMAKIEAAEEIKDDAELMIAPETSMQLKTLPLELILKDMQNHINEKELSPFDLAQYFIFEVAGKSEAIQDLTVPALSSFNLAKLDNFEIVFKNIFKYLKILTENDPQIKKNIRNDIGKTQTFSNNQRDLEHLAEIIINDTRINDLKLKDLASQLIFVKRELLQKEEHTQNSSNARGLSIYLPLNYREEDGIEIKNEVYKEFLKVISVDFKLYNFLKNQGVSSRIIKMVDKILEKSKQIFSWGMNYFENIGSFEAQIFARRGEAKNYPPLSKEKALPLGILGGIHKSVRNINEIINHFKNHEFKINSIGEALEGVSGLTDAGTCFNLLAKNLKMAHILGNISIISPIIKMLVDTILGIKELIRIKKDENEDKKLHIANAGLNSFSQIITAGASLAFNISGIATFNLPAFYLAKVSSYINSAYKTYYIFNEIQKQTKESENIPLSEKLKGI